MATTPILSSLLVWLAVLGALLLLGALTLFLLWANDVPLPSLAALRRAPRMVTPRPADEHVHVHLPPPSYWPLVLAIAITVIAAGLMTHWLIALVGALATIGSVVAWAFEPGH